MQLMRGNNLIMCQYANELGWWIGQLSKELTLSEQRVHFLYVLKLTLCRQSIDTLQTGYG